MRIAEAAIAAAREHRALADRGEIGDQCVLVVLENLCTERYFQHHVGAIGAMAVLAHAVTAAARLEVLLVAVVDQRIETVDTFGDDIAAAAAVAAVRPAEFDEFFPPERDAAFAAVAGTDVDLSFV